MSKITSRKPTFVVLLAFLFAFLGTVGLGLAGTPDSAEAASVRSAPEAPAYPEALGLLPGDTSNGPAALMQENPQIAAGANGYLVVWEDSRANYAGIMGNMVPNNGSVSGQTLKDIFAARLDANGQLLDTTPIPISQAAWDQTRPRVAWNGQNWLVVWNTERVAGFSSTTDVMAARVSPQGVVLDTPPIFVDGSDTVDELYPVVASEGSDWAVVWMDQGSYFELRAARVSPEGVVREPSGVAIYTPQFPAAPYNASLAFAGDKYLLTWSQWTDSSDDIVGVRLSPTLQPIGSPFNIARALGYQIYPWVASNGTDFLVAWQDERDLQTRQVYAARVSATGVVLDPNGLNVSGGNGGYPYPRVAWDGTRWFVAWDTYGSTTRVARISTAGSVLDPGGIVVASGNAMYPGITAAIGGGARLVWVDSRAGGPQPEDIYSAGVSATGVVGAAAPVAMGGPSQQRPHLAAGDNGYLAVFQRRTSGETRIMAQRLDAAGSAIDPEPLMIAGGSASFTNPSVAWNGSLYLVVWEDTSQGVGFAPGMVLGRRVLPNGSVLDPTPITITPGNAPDVAALGDTFLVAATHEPTNHQRYPKAVCVRGADGVVLGSPVSLGTIYATRTHIAVLGNRWLVTWQRNPTHDNPYATISAAFVSPEGVPAGEFQVATATSKTPDVAAKADQALIVFYRDNEVRGRRVLPDGTLLDGTSGFAITSAANPQFMPSVAWNGSEYVVAYEDHRNVAYLDRPVSDVFATRVDANATVLDPAGFALASSPLPEVLPDVAALPASNSYIVAMSNFVPSAPYSAYRIAVYTPQSAPLMMAGHVNWQGRPPQPSPLQALPVTLTLKLGNVEQSYSGVTDNSGNFSVNIASLPAGTYQWWVKGPKFLANAGTVVLPSTVVEMGTLRAGDANNDNRVDATDFNLLRSNFGRGVGDPGYDQRADLNGDDRVNALDFTLLRNNFGQSGAPPPGPAR